MRGICSSSLHKKLPTAVKHFKIYWVMTDHVSFEWGYTSCSQVFSCKQFGDFSLDRWEMFVPNKGSSSSLNKKSQQLSSTFWIYWVMTDHVLLEWAFTGYDQVFSCKQFVDIDWLNACQAAKIIHKCYAWMPQCCLCPYRYWSMLGVHANAKAEDWLGAAHSQ